MWRSIATIKRSAKKFLGLSNESGGHHIKACEPTCDGSETSFVVDTNGNHGFTQLVDRTVLNCPQLGGPNYQADADDQHQQDSAPISGIRTLEQFLTDNPVNTADFDHIGQHCFFPKKLKPGSPQTELRVKQTHPILEDRRDVDAGGFFRPANDSNEIQCSEGGSCSIEPPIRTGGAGHYDVFGVAASSAVDASIANTQQICYGGEGEEADDTDDDDHYHDCYEPPASQGGLMVGGDDATMVGKTCSPRPTVKSCRSQDLHHPTLETKNLIKSDIPSRCQALMSPRSTRSSVTAATESSTATSRCPHGASISDNEGEHPLPPPTEKPSRLTDLSSAPNGGISPFSQGRLGTKPTKNVRWLISLAVM
eukprot:GHVN01068409.1.p1 GENE.GHVN01068409.1~~GHVN01068409.1.p1  ORF type:complete len:366 (-),score=54.60 GHVN01068409.1:2539-3636(-)